MEVVYRTKIVKVGNSLAVIIPKPLLLEKGWGVGDRISVDTGPNNTIIVTWLGSAQDVKPESPQPDIYEQRL